MSKLTMESSIPEKHRISVSYSSLPTLKDFESIRADLQRQTPLRNLHWVRKTGANRSVRTIQSLDIVWRVLDSQSDAKALSLLQRPYLNLLFVVCEDNETYRAVLRPQIREWLDSIQSNSSTRSSSQEWLIIHVTSGKNNNQKFYQRKSTVIDKIKADFNNGKKDRCIQVAQGASADDPTAWAEFSNKVKEGVLATFDSNVSLYEEDVRKADSQRQLAGWQFQPFFLQKEALADSFEAIGLLEDALIQYDELEASFFQAVKEHNMAWFGAVGGLGQGDDALPLLSFTNKPYRSLIQANKISIFDFRIYIFARQASFLARLGRIAELAKRGAYFVSTFARTLREHQNSLGQYFVESWTYSACLNIVDNCQVWIEGEGIDRKTAAGFVAVKAELLELSRKQVDKIGIGSGHLPLSHPFSMALNETTSGTPPNFEDVSNRPPVTRKDLLDAIASQAAFDKLFIDLTNRSIQAYSQSGRKRCSLKLHASLAALEHHRERTESAQKLFSHLPAHYIDLRWTKIESALLARCTKLQGQLKMDKERLLSTLALIRAGVEFESKVWDLRGVMEIGEDKTELARTLMKDVYELSKELSKDFAAIAFPTFAMRLASDRGTIAQDEDGVNVRLIIKSLLPCSLDIDEVRLKFAKPDGEQVWFTAGKHTLTAAGETEIELFCPTAVTGRLALELSQIRFSRIIFQYSHRPVSSRNLAPDPRNMPMTSGKQPVATFPRDYQALEVYCEVPRQIHLDQERTALVCIAVGRNQVTKITLRAVTNSATLSFATVRSQLHEGQATLSFPVGVEDTIVVESIESNLIKIEIPLIGQINEASLDISLSAEYLTVKRPATRRSIKRNLPFNIALPLAVNVQDFFREDSLLSKFSVTTDGINALRIRSAHLEGIPGVTVKPCRGVDSPILTVLPFQTANFLFKLFKAATAQFDDPLRLTLTYCTSEEEIRSRVADVISTLLANASSSIQMLEPWLIESIGADVLASTRTEDFALDPRFYTLSFEPIAWTQRITSLSIASESELLSVVEEIYESLRSADSPVSDTTPWRTLTIPVDLPALNVLNLIKLTPAYTRTEIGQALPVELSIRPTFNWTNLIEMPESLKLAYDLTINHEDWLIAGKKKGEFVASPEKETTIALSFVALRSGSLFLPSVVVSRVKPKAGDATQGMDEDLAFSCESQSLNAARVIEVLPLSSSSTFEIEDMEHQKIPIAV